MHHEDECTPQQSVGCARPSRDTIHEMLDDYISAVEKSIKADRLALDAQLLANNLHIPARAALREQNEILTSLTTAVCDLFRKARS